MPVRRRVGRPRVRRRVMRGGNIFSSIWNGLKKVHSFVKDNKLISRGLGGLGYGSAGAIAGQLGYRPRRRVVRRRVVRRR